MGCVEGGLKWTLGLNPQGLEVCVNFHLQRIPSTPYYLLNNMFVLKWHAERANQTLKTKLKWASENCGQLQIFF